MAQAATHDLLLPQPPGGMVRGALLALLAHALLVVALTTAVNWRATTPDAISAELWAAVPQVAAPRAVEPPPRPSPPPVTPKPEPAPAPRAAPPPPKAEPAPPDPQIALAREKAEREKIERERAERAKVERERLEREKVEKDRAEREQKERAVKERARQEAEARKREQLERERKAEEQRLAELREKNLERLRGQMNASGSPTSSGTAAQDAGPSRSYAGRLVAAIKPNIVFTDSISGNPAAEVEVRAAPGGSIIARRLVRSSGHKDWDEAVLRAIDRTASLPRDVDGRVPSTILLTFRPQE